jgi:hypothetical protein
VAGAADPGSRIVNAIFRIGDHPVVMGQRTLARIVN